MAMEFIDGFIDGHPSRFIRRVERQPIYKAEFFSSEPVVFIMLAFVYYCNYQVGIVNVTQ